MKFTSSILAALALTTTGALAKSVHIILSENTTLCLGPIDFDAPIDHQVVVIPCGTGNATFPDLTALTVSSTSPKKQTHFKLGSMCASIDPADTDPTESGIVNWVPCSNDPNLLWTFNADGSIENYAGRCLTIGKPSANGPATVWACGTLPEKQTWSYQVL